jgi:hypothetical protein
VVVIGALSACVLASLSLLILSSSRARQPEPTESKVTVESQVESRTRVPLSTYNESWADVVREAMKPGTLVASDGLGREEWKTGQPLPSAGDSTKDYADWRVFKLDQPGRERRMQQFYVCLEKKVPMAVLRRITERVLLDAPAGYHTTWITFYTRWALGQLIPESMEPLELSKVHSWATCRLDVTPKPAMFVRIDGLSVEDEARLRAVPHPPRIKILGSWIAEDSGGRETIFRGSDDLLHLQELNVFKLTPAYSELIELPSSDGRRFETKDSDDDVNYFLIEDGGDLQIRCKDGTVYRAQAIR